MKNVKLALGFYLSNFMIIKILKTDFLQQEKMKTIIPFKLLSLQGRGYHLSIPALVNGKKIHLLIDTGASLTVFDKERFEKIAKDAKIDKNKHDATGLGTSNMKAFEVVLKKFAIGKLEVKNYRIGLLDLSHVNKSYESIGKKPIDGVLGSDFMKKYNAVINYEKKTISLHKK